jgi:O-antigen ligase
MTGSGGLRSIDRYGRLLLFTVYVTLLAGRFTPDRLGALPAWDVRLGFALVVGLLCLTWATVAQEPTRKTGIGATFGWFLAWVGWMAVSAGWAPKGARTGDVLVDLALLTGFCWAGWGAAGRISLPALSTVWWWLYVTGWLYLAGALVAGPGVQGRYSAFGGGPNVFVRVMDLACLATLVLAVTKRKRWVLLGLPAFLLGAYLSGSRGGLLALLPILLVGGPVLLRRVRGRGIRAVAVGAPLLLLVGGLLRNPSWLAFGQERFVQETFSQGYDSERGSIVARALELFETHLWFGTGLDGFFPLQIPWTNAEYPHNLVLATAAEGGLVGLGLLGGTLLGGTAAVLRRRPLGENAFGFVLAASCLFLAALFSGDYYDSRFLWFFLGLAVIAAQKESAARGRAPTAVRPAGSPFLAAVPAAAAEGSRG